MFRDGSRMNKIGSQEQRGKFSIVSVKHTTNSRFCTGLSLGRIRTADGNSWRLMAVRKYSKYYVKITLFKLSTSIDKWLIRCGRLKWMKRELIITCKQEVIGCCAGLTTQSASMLISTPPRRDCSEFWCAMSMFGSNEELTTAGKTKAMLNRSITQETRRTMKLRLWTT